MSKHTLFVVLQFFDPKSPLDDDVIKVTLPMLCKMITPWEYALARARQSTTKEALFPAILNSLKEMHAEARKMASSCLEGFNDATSKNRSPKGS